MPRTNISVYSISSIQHFRLIARSHRNSLVFDPGCYQQPFPFWASQTIPSLSSFSTPPKRSFAHVVLTTSSVTRNNTFNQLPHYCFWHRNIYPSMRTIVKVSSMKRPDGSSFTVKASIATATATVTLAAYYFATTIFFGSFAGVHSDSTPENIIFNLEKKLDDNFGIEYVGFDSYPGIQFDDGTGVATKEETASSTIAVSRALKAAGLDETSLMTGAANGREEDNSLHPNYAHRIGVGTCPLYGCPLLPLDVHYNDDAKTQLAKLRKGTALENDKKMILTSAGSEKAATLTLIGYKGGRADQQINQDRALAIVPYSYKSIGSSFEGENNTGMSTSPHNIGVLIGAFDGHAKFGEKVSEYTVKTLPALLGSKLVEYDAMMLNENKKLDEHMRDIGIGKIMRETFLELDATSPADPSGGCTASVVLRLGTKLYIANSGDSRSFIAVHVKSASRSEERSNDKNQSFTKIVFATREDKPHIPTERDRVEHMGGTVYLPNGFLTTGKGTTRVLYQDPITGSTSGLAMSRSIGDWDAGEVGVIPDPLIDVLDMKDIKRKVLEELNKGCNEKDEMAVIDPATGESKSIGQCATYTEDDVKIFAISATDGLLDYLPVQSIVNHIAQGLYGSTYGKRGANEQPVSHPLLACEDLIYAAAQGWQDDKGGRYRDDIAIAVVDLEI